MLVAGVGVLAWVYQSVQPPQPKMVTAVTSPKIKLKRRKAFGIQRTRSPQRGSQVQDESVAG